MLAIEKKKRKKKNKSKTVTFKKYGWTAEGPRTSTVLVVFIGSLFSFAVCNRTI